MPLFFRNGKILGYTHTLPFPYATLSLGLLWFINISVIRFARRDTDLQVYRIFGMSKTYCIAVIRFNLFSDIYCAIFLYLSNEQVTSHNDGIVIQVRKLRFQDLFIKISRFY